MLLLLLLLLPCLVLYVRICSRIWLNLLLQAGAVYKVNTKLLGTLQTPKLHWCCLLLLAAAAAATATAVLVIDGRDAIVGGDWEKWRGDRS